MHPYPDINLFHKKPAKGLTQQPLRPPTDESLNRTLVMAELQAAGLNRLAMRTHEATYLPKLIHPGEHIGGAALGWSQEGVVMMVATDRRVIYLDRKPLFVLDDDISYKVVSGVSLRRSSLGTIITLHTRIKNYTIRTINRSCAEQFVRYIESRSLEHTQDEVAQ